MQLKTSFSLTHLSVPGHWKLSPSISSGGGHICTSLSSITVLSYSSFPLRVIMKVYLASIGGMNETLYFPLPKS